MSTRAAGTYLAAAEPACQLAFVGTSWQDVDLGAPSGAHTYASQRYDDIFIAKFAPDANVSIDCASSRRRSWYLRDMRRAGLLGLTLAAVSWLGCESIAGLGDFEREPEPTGGGNTATGGGGGGGQGGAFEQRRASHSISFGSSGTDEFRGLDTGTNSIFVAGTHSGTLQLVHEHTNDSGKNPFFAGLAANLALGWSGSYESAGDTNVRWLSARGNRANIAGWVQSEIDFGGDPLTPDGVSDGYWVQFGANGLHTNSAMGHATQTQQAWAIAAYGSGAIMGGLFSGELSFEGSAETMTSQGGSSDGYVVWLNDGGGLGWAVQIKGNGGEQVRSIAVDEDNQRVFVAGIHDDDATAGLLPDAETCTLDHSHPDAGSLTYDAFILVLQLTDGTCIDAVVFQDTLEIEARDLDFRGDALTFVGAFRGALDLGADPLVNSTGDLDAFVAKFDLLTGDIHQAQWSAAYGGSGDQVAHSTAIDREGNVIAVGHFEQSVDFGDGSQTANGADAFVVKLGPDGGHGWSGVYGGPDRDTARRVCVDEADNVIIGGEFDRQIYFGVGEAHVSDASQDVFVAKFPPTPEIGPEP